MTGINRKLTRRLEATGSELRRPADQDSRAETGQAINDLLIIGVLNHLGGSARAGQLRSVMLPTAAAVSVALSRLSEAGLVTRGEDPEDARARMVSLTPKGKSEVERTWSSFTTGQRRYSRR